MTSASVTDKFMKALENGEKYELISSHNGEAADTIDAREVFENIVNAARRCGGALVRFSAAAP